MTKRCKNCGWPNDDNNVKCEKCYAPLSDEGSSSSRQSFSQTARESGGDSFRRTVSENQFFGSKEPAKEEPKVNQEPENTPKPEQLNCPKCGYPVRQGMHNCPDCGASLFSSSNGSNKAESGKKCPNCGSLNNLEARFCNQCGEVLETRQRDGVSVVKANRLGTVNPWMKPDNGAFCTLKPIAWVGENVSHQPLSFSGESVLLNRANTDPNNQSITTSEQAELTFENGEWYILDKSSQHTTYVLASQKIQLHKGDTIVLGNRLFEFN